MTCPACNELRKARDELYVELGKARAECERLQSYVDKLIGDLKPRVAALERAAGKDQ